MIYRQGDVILEEIKKLPKGLVLNSKELRIIGETGQAHIMEIDEFTPLRIRGIEYPKYTEYAVVKRDTAMVHPEHPSLDVPSGYYGIRRVRTFEPGGAIDVIE
ncbi:hypothetical protein LCGC14_1735990 [marine sediment metagenome]|uniref:Uncharacterized protein n=1 Tax=marine sediment metagenome TaxID=412755 RepID=A0A0F9H801_9ZZZZ